MGKEAKIGLSVILILLVTLGVVLARKLGNPGEDGESPASNATTARSDGDSSDSSKTDSQRKASGSARPTLIEAKSGKAMAGNQRPSTSKVGQWSVVSDTGPSKQQTAGTVAKSAPPSYMPNAPSDSRSAAQYDPYKATDPSGRTASTWRMDQGAGTGYRETRTPGVRTPAGYGPIQPSNPMRQADPGKPPIPAAPNPLRGPAGAMIAPQQPSAPQTSTDGYRPGAYGSQPRRGAGYATSGTARSTYTPTPPPVQPISQYGGARPAPAPAAGDFKTQYSPDYAQREDGKYEVRPNDTFWSISERLYGSGAYFKALAEHNREKYPKEDQLDVGDVILAPTQAELEQTYAELCPTRQHVETARLRASAVSTAAQYGTGPTYVVQEGDTLYDIARWELGKSTRWTEIYDLNRDVLGADHDHLPPGIALQMPGGQPADTVTQRPGRSYQR